VGRAALAALFLLGFGVAGALSAGVAATVLTTGTTTTTATTTAPTTTGSTTEPAATIAPGVSIAGLDVGGLTPDEAYVEVQAFFSRPLALLVGKRRLAVSPARLGGVPYVRTAVARARAAAPGTAVELAVAVRGASTRSYVAGLARRFDRKPVDARLVLRAFRPVITSERPGRSLDRALATRALVRALRTHRRSALRLRLRSVRPAVTRGSFGRIVVIRRESKRLYLYEGMRFRRVFGVATGQSSYPTPLGRFSIAVKWRNPWWYPPPNSDWARGSKPIPPGAGNPLGTRWMGLTAPLVGIHGTPDAASIGYSASHGCIRMRISDAEWLFDQVSIGTLVFIVSA
jgi:lipoprotein-anchoring transpeptidase ErfK/SrfK